MFDESMSIPAIKKWAETASSDELTEAIRIEAEGRNRKGALEVLRDAIQDEVNELIDGLQEVDEVVEAPKPEPAPAAPPPAPAPAPVPASPPPEPELGSVHYEWRKVGMARMVDLTFKNSRDKAMFGEKVTWNTNQSAWVNLPGTSGDTVIHFDKMPVAYRDPRWARRFAKKP